MAVINPDVAGIMQKAEKNSKYNLIYIEHLKNLLKNKKARMKALQKSPSMKMDSWLMMDNSKIMTIQKINNSWKNLIKVKYHLNYEKNIQTEIYPSVYLTRQNPNMYLLLPLHTYLSQDKEFLFQSQ